MENSAPLPRTREVFEAMEARQDKIGRAALIVSMIRTLLKLRLTRDEYEKVDKGLAAAFATLLDEKTFNEFTDKMMVGITTVFKDFKEKSEDMQRKPL